MHKFVDNENKPNRGVARSIYGADKIISVSEHTKNDILRFYPVSADKVAVTSLGISSHIKKLNKSDIEEFRKKKGLDYEYIMYVGSFLPNKNVERIVEAFLLAKKKNGIRHKLLLMGGEGPIRRRIQKLVYKRGAIEDIFILNYVSDKELNLFYNAASLFLFPSLYEGFGLPVLEAMVAGVPVVTSTAGSLPEVAGDSAIFVDPYNIEEIADSIWRAVSDKILRNELRDKGLARIKNFTWRKMAEETLEIYKETLRIV
jgi:glycosyltransferase involved in cell wall biosynthesis